MSAGPETKASDPTTPSAAGPRQDPAERKRREARRRLLLGGAAALPVMLSVKRANAVNTWTQCAEILEAQNPDTVFGWSQFIAGARNYWGSVALFPPVCTEENIQMSFKNTSGLPKKKT